MPQWTGKIPHAASETPCSQRKRKRNRTVLSNSNETRASCGSGLCKQILQQPKCPLASPQSSAGVSQDISPFMASTTFLSHFSTPPADPASGHRVLIPASLSPLPGPSDLCADALTGGLQLDCQLWRESLGAQKTAEGAGGGWVSPAGTLLGIPCSPAPDTGGPLSAAAAEPGGPPQASSPTSATLVSSPSLSWDHQHRCWVTVSTCLPFPGSWWCSLRPPMRHGPPWPHQCLPAPGSGKAALSPHSTLAPSPLLCLSPRTGIPSALAHSWCSGILVTTWWVVVGEQAGGPGAPRGGAGAQWWGMGASG